ncbi:hypothetical protein KAU11_10880 [Candidatus Babeliales bacterium]|nr:hypothetical protein [Candidatus Babeliales bacterium]
MVDLPVKATRVTYMNYRGEMSVRWIIPKRIFWGSNEWHPTKQWLMEARDTDKKADRIFALAQMDFADHRTA